MRQRVPLVISLLALLVALLGTTPLGRAAGNAVAAAGSPFAKTAGYAKVAGDPGKLNGHKCALGGAPGTFRSSARTASCPPRPAPSGRKAAQAPRARKATKETPARAVPIRSSFARRRRTPVAIRRSKSTVQQARSRPGQCVQRRPRRGGPERSDSRRERATPTGWHAELNFATTIQEDLYVYAVCASP
jgi:hypothetical protein